MEEKIILSHGNGGLYSQILVKELFCRYYGNALLEELNDAARFPSPGEKLAFTTDSYVITPLIFPGGDIGKLAVCGTINDLAVSGARPLYLSVGFIIEEGLSMKLLTEIVVSMAGTAKDAGVKIVTGDTKVVLKGGVDKLFINTSGLGVINNSVDVASSYARPGDRVVLSGTMGDHGMAIMAARSEIDLITNIKSDCAPLNHLITELLESVPDIKVLRDPTRGGVATVLNEIAGQSAVGIALEEDFLPVKDSVRSACDMLGLDPLYLANEGKFLAVVPQHLVDRTMGILRRHPLGENAAVIGKVVEDLPGKVYINTIIGGKRVINVLMSDQLPRIC